MVDPDAFVPGAIVVMDLGLAGPERVRLEEVTYFKHRNKYVIRGERLAPCDGPPFFAGVVGPEDMELVQ
jgi:hypothetical protein